MKRRKAREYALQFLYRIDFVDTAAAEVSGQDLLPDLKGDLRDFWEGAGEQDREVQAFAEDIITGTLRSLKEIDAELRHVAEKWSLSRMASIDRNILRFAAYELLFRKDIPAAVTINEALEIAKKYSTAESAAFINGLLDRIARERAQRPR